MSCCGYLCGLVFVFECFYFCTVMYLVHLVYAFNNND